MKTKGFGTILLVILVAIAAFLGGLYFSNNKQTPIAQTSQTVTPTAAVEGESTLAPSVTTIGNFMVTGEEVCLENGKPLVYFFGGSYCSHCQWEHPLLEKVVKKFGSVITFHNNFDKQDADREIWNKYASINQGGVPFIVVGCQYARVGSGENFGQEKETEYLTALICKITDNKPASVCDPVKDTVDQISQ